MKKKEFEKVEDKEDIKTHTLELSKSDLITDSRLNMLVSKHSFVIAIFLVILAVSNLLFIIFNIYDIISARSIIPLMLMLIIAVLYVNDYLFQKEIKNIIVHRYIDRMIEEVLNSTSKDSIDNKED